MPTNPPPDRLSSPVHDEHALASGLAAELGPGTLDWPAVVRTARPWVEAVRAHPAPFWALESLLREFPLSSTEGLALMRLAEALLRVPDSHTALLLTADQLRRADFTAHAHPGLARLAAQAIELSKRWLPDPSQHAPGLLQRLGEQAVLAGTLRAIQLLGQQFVLGQTIDEARRRGEALRAAHPSPLRFSFDMLGEGARSDADALHYLAAYRHALAALAAGTRPTRPEEGDGISIKLSALEPRFEPSQHATVMRRLVPRVVQLADDAAQAGLPLTIDAEESDRLELTLHVLDAVAAEVAARHPGWTGLGLAVQAYQQRAPQVIDAVAALAQHHGLRLMVRLVKGAYWDSEIKRAQELGLPGYPVWTHKSHTDLAYLACARRLLAHVGRLYPQFATHNAATLAAVLQLARRAGAPFELQRLHGMGEGVYSQVLADRSAWQGQPAALRVYAPVGQHRDLLAYLVRRLLENGANSSFVNRLADETVDPAVLLASPLAPLAHPGQPLPPALYGAQRPNAAGLDLASAPDRAPIEAALAQAILPRPPADAQPLTIDTAMEALAAAQPAWAAVTLPERAACLQRAATLLEARLPPFVALLVHEAGKTWADAVAEVREAVDLCRYYAQQAQSLLAPETLPGPTGERNELRLRPRGVFVCISPWNFPLAIFGGQVVAALVCGNAVAAKPAEQTPRVAAAFIDLLVEAGVPRQAVALVCGPGETVGAGLVAQPRCAGVAFTGSFAAAKAIQRSLAASDGPIVPLIAETGGVNAMVVDSTALPEQVIDAVVQSAFRSAGQRCSALRLLCVQADIADALLDLLRGAMQELVVGPATDWATDVGPVIDASAHATLSQHVARLEREARLIARTPMDAQWSATHIAPVAFEVQHVADVPNEVFGPVLHVLRWQGDPARLIEQINALGHGLTLGLQTRIDSRAAYWAEQARVGNVYVNRNMIGAVVGVQPFGGEGLSGTGPKAGGPHYLARFCTEQTLSINTAAAGGNATLLAGPA